MKIGFDAKRAFTNYTGLGNYSRFIIKGLAEHYPNNDYLLYTPVVKEGSELEFIKEKSNIHIKAPSKLVSLIGLKSFWRSFSLNHVISSDKLDIYHGLSNELPYGKKKTPQVVTIHDLLFLRYPKLYKPVDVEIYKRKWKHAVTAADKVVAISKQTAEDLTTFLGVSPSRIKIVYQGCNEIFKQGFDEKKLLYVKEKYCLPDSFILNVGTIEPRKNALLIVKALALLKKETTIKLVIVGRETDYKAIIEDYSRKEKLEERIIFLHNVEYLDLPAVFKLSDFLIYPSIFEGFGIPIVEALEVGTPVITSKGSAFSEAGGANSLYVNPAEEAELADSILTLINNPALKESMIMKGKEYVKRFHSNVIAENMMEVYNSL